VRAAAALVVALLLIGACGGSSAGTRASRRAATATRPATDPSKPEQAGPSAQSNPTSSGAPNTTRGTTSGTEDTVAPGPRSADPVKPDDTTPTSGTRAASSVSGAGIIAGRVVRPQGQDPRSGATGGTSAPVPVSGDPVEVRRAGKVVSRSVTALDGGFSAVVAPGSYDVVESICGARTSVRVGESARVDVTLTLPSAC
jgi:hypothetical protein